MRTLKTKIMQLWNRLLGKSINPQLPAPIEIGAVVHRLTDEDVTSLRTLGIRHLRISLYPNLDGERWIDRAIAEGFTVLAVTYRNAVEREVDRLRWPTVIWQYGNEPDTTKVGAKEVAMQSMGGEVSPGFRNETPSIWMSDYKTFAPASQILAIHIYGDELTLATQNRLTAIKNINAKFWVTEIGKIDGDGESLSKSFDLMRSAGIERVYVYALWSPDDKYSLTTAQKLAIKNYD